MTTTTTNSGSKVGRGRRRLGQLWQVPMFLVGLLALIGVAGSAPWRLTPQERDFVTLVDTLRQALEQGESGDALVAHAEAVQIRLHLFHSRSAEAHFLVGSAYYRQAQGKSANQAKEIWPRAIEHLEEALTAGVADADKAALQYRLGFALCQQNAEASRGLELMMLGVEKGAEQPLQGYQWLLQANLKRKPPNLDAALAASARILDLTPDRDIDAVSLARLQHAELYLRKEQHADALRELERIGPKASRTVRVKARLLQARCCEEDGLYSKAIPIWQELLPEEPFVEGGKARVLYALGWCQHNLDPPNDSEAVRAWAEAAKLSGSEAQAAGLHLGRLRLAQGGDQVPQALADWAAALETVQSPQDFNNPYIPKEQVSDWFKQAIQIFHDAQDPQKTQAIAELYRKIGPLGSAEFGLGEAAEQLARLLLEKSNAQPSTATRAEVQAQFRRAAEAYEQAASARPEAERGESLWRSARCYESANETGRAQEQLLRLVKVETRESRLAEGWNMLGDLYRLEGKQNSAREAYLKCLQYPNTPFAYRSRYHLAVEEIEKKNLPQAREILKQNLAGGGSVDIERTWHEQSLYKMAMLLVEMKNYDEARIHLEEFRRLFPENKADLVVKDQLGRVYRELADVERVELERLQFKSDMPPEKRESMMDQIQRRRKTRADLLMAAFRTHQELADELQQMVSQTKQLSPFEMMLLRRSHLGIGLCLLDNSEFEDALKSFQKLQSNSRRSLEGFYASQFICYTVQTMPLQQMPQEKANSLRAQAVDSVRQVVEDVKGLPADHEIFRSPGAWQRENWLNWAAEAERKLTTPPRDERGLPTIR